MYATDSSLTTTYGPGEETWATFWDAMLVVDGHWYWNGPNSFDEAAAQYTAWALENSPVPVGYSVTSVCDVALCCRPAHLAVVETAVL